MDNLYLVICKGMQSNIGGSTAHGIAHIIAPDPTTAYKILRKSLDERGLGLTRERELHSIELIASASEYPDCGIRLYGKAIKEVDDE